MGDTSARQRLTEELSGLRQDAGMPSLQEMGSFGTRQKPPVKLGKSKLSSWFSGTAVPEAGLPFSLLVQWLEVKAQRKSGRRPRGERWWTALRNAADRERQPAAVPGADTAERPAEPPGRPQRPPALVGREAMEEELLRVLEPGGPPATVVSGLAGIGKTALVLTVAERAASGGGFEGGTLFVAMHGYDRTNVVSADQAVSDLLVQLGVRSQDIPPTPRGRLALYHAELAAQGAAHRRVLIVLDDVAEVGQVLPLLPATPVDTHQVLVTSRDSLVAPDFHARSVRLEELSISAACTLVTRRLLLADPQDERPDTEPDALADIARYCGCLPLALTVVSALLARDPGLSLASVASYLADARTRLDALTFESGSGMPIGVRAAFEVSYARLPPDLARAFRLFTVNPGPDCHTAHLAVLLVGEDSEDLGPVQLRGLLARLADTGLISEHPRGSHRWHMHDLVRLYALEVAARHAREDDRQDAAERLLASYGVLLTVCDGYLNGLADDPWREHFPQLPDAAASLHWLNDERHNLIALVDLAVAIDRPEHVFGIAQHLQPYLHHRGLHQEAVDVNRSALAEARRIGHVEAERTATDHLALALALAGSAEEGAALLEPSLSSRLAGAPKERIDGLLRSAAMRSSCGRPEEAEVLLEQCLALCQELGDKQSEAKAWIGLGSVLSKQGRFGEAATAYERAGALSTATGHTLAAARARRSLGQALLKAGRPDDAVAAQEGVLNTLLEHGDPLEIAETCRSLAEALHAADRTAEAVDLQHAAADGYGLGGDVANQARVLFEAGELSAGLGDFEHAIVAYQRACALYKEIADRSGEGTAHMFLAEALHASGRTEDAAAALRDCIAAYQETGDEELVGLASLLYEVRTTEQP
jgi:tetratricopeptide (TPR) repeat protein